MNRDERQGRQWGWMGRVALALAVLVGVAACDDDDGDPQPQPDAADQTQNDTSPDTTAPDTSTPDTSDPDTPTPDATNDTDDASDTTEPDASDATDTTDVTDTSDTTDVTDTDTVDPLPEGCPTALDYVGDASWPLHIIATDTALYCGLANESFRDWETMTVDWPQQRAHRVQLQLAPGTYPLPSADGEYALRLPLCVYFERDGAPSQLAGDGTLQITSNTFEGTRYVFYSYQQPMLSADGTTSWVAEVTLSGMEPKEALATQLDGLPLNRFNFGANEGDLSTQLMLCSPHCTAPDELRFIDACHFVGFDTRRHLVTFDGGSVELDLRYGVSPASTEPGQFERASGTLDGTAFEYENYWDLVYTPEHHHFARHFLVLFDEPIGEACALAAEGLDENYWDEFGPEPAVRLLDCGLNELEERRVTGDDFERIPAP